MIMRRHNQELLGAPLWCTTQQEEGLWIQRVNVVVPQRRVFVCASELTLDESFSHQHMGAVYHRGRSPSASTNESHRGGRDHVNDQELLGAPLQATGEFDCFSAHIHLREPDKSEDKAECEATDNRVMGLAVPWYRRGGTSVEASIPCSHGRRGLVVKGAEEVENAKANSKYQDRAEGQRPRNFIRPPSNLAFSTTTRMGEVKYLSSLTYPAEELCISFAVHGTSPSRQRRRKDQKDGMSVVAQVAILGLQKGEREEKAEGATTKEEEGMSKLWTSCSAGCILAILLDDCLSFCTFLTSHPLHLAYLLFFFPYLAQLLSFLSPLLLSTVVLLLVLLTISPYLDEAPPAAPPEFVGKTCCIVLSILKDNLHGNGRIDLLDQFASIILSSIDDASPSSQESAAQALFGECFEDACSDPEAEDKCLASAVGGGGSSLEETPADVALGISAIDGEHQVANSGTGSPCRATAAQAEGMPNAREILGSQREVAEPKRDEDRAENLTESMTIERLQSYGSIRKERKVAKRWICSGRLMRPMPVRLIPRRRRKQGELTLKKRKRARKRKQQPGNCAAFKH
ncbi:hypothetical protein GW17_00006370 [Ensete ventricosum]|nr:hypothetical protein GW17_00006370 [Ensete ventricosum]